MTWSEESHTQTDRTMKYYGMLSVRKSPSSFYSFRWWNQKSLPLQSGSGLEL